MGKSLIARILPAMALICGMSLLANDNISTLQFFMENCNVLVDSKLHLDLSQSFSYNDNIDEDLRSDRSGTWSTSTALDASLIKNFNDNSIGIIGGVAYKHDFHKGKNDDSKGFTYYLAPVLNGNYKFGKNTLMINAISEYKTSEIDRSKRMTVMEAVNGVSVGWSSEITGKTVLALTADYKNKHFTDNDFKGYNSQIYGVKFAPYWNASDRTRIGLNAGVERTSYNHKDLHDDKNRFNFGAYGHYQLTERASVFAEAGAEQTKYQDNTVSADNSDDDFDFYAKAGADYVASDDLRFRFYFARTQEDSWGMGARGVRTEYSADLSATWKLTGKLTMVNALSYDFADEKTARSDADEYGYDLTFNYKYSDAITFKAGYSLQIVDYAHMRRDFLANEVSFGLVWSIK